MQDQHQFFTNNSSSKTPVFGIIMFKFVVLVVSISAVFAYPGGYGGGNPEGDAQIKHLENELHHDGSYRYAYETSNGISAQEQGVGGHQAVGGFSFISPEGIPISLSYAADEHGFRAQGDHLPVPPPIPEEILKSLQWNAAHPEEDDPKYEKASRHY